METRANYATIGIFTLAVLVACFAFVYWLARYDENGARKPMRVLIPGSVTGLATGSQVLFNGIRIGDVTSLRINPQDPNQVEAMVSVDPNQPIKSDTKASVGVQGLTGIASIEFRGGSANLPSIFDEQEIPTLIAQGSGLSEILESAQELLKKANVTVDRVNSVLETAEPSVKVTLSNVQKFTSALADNSEGVNDFLANVSDLSKKIGDLSGNLQGLVGKADNILAAVDPSKVANAINQIDTVVTKLSTAADSFPQIVDNIKKVSEQLSGTLDSARQIVEAVQVEAVKSTIQDIATVARRVQTATVDINKIVSDAGAAVSDARDFVGFVKKQQPQVDQIVANTDQLMGRLNQASARLDTILGGAEDLVKDPNGKNFFREAAAAATSIRKVADAFSGRADDISKNLADFTGQGLRNVDQLVLQLQRATNQFNRTLNSVQNNPQGFVFGNPTVKDYNRK
ncbi:phospholipid/cholesterol/gamma-HCH transport system substrate-binding protein [Kaistia soli DSM 19436]|uniref:Phospholipid/cholesterol/gamma-HCH transport system substrate-binding protein n=1 Tax=Kaistia soli DSM 19436 TaxID=1122133 RepID=A0A1M5GT38_9HYPH|nr:MCE family protein [Kaistia soli]SHG06787.1 phospholipid/cholesterol/gamma-HCH transport system substrate-binding protein [Kaistia soli DSM 19436]